MTSGPPWESRDVRRLQAVRHDRSQISWRRYTGICGVADFVGDGAIHPLCRHAAGRSHSGRDAEPRKNVPVENDPSGDDQDQDESRGHAAEFQRARRQSHFDGGANPAGNRRGIIERMMALGLMSTPGVAIDGKVVISGRIPKADEVRQLLGVAGAR